MNLGPRCRDLDPTPGFGDIGLSDCKAHANKRTLTAIAVPATTVARATLCVMVRMAMILRSSCEVGSESIGANIGGALERRCAMVSISNPYRSGDGCARNTRASQSISIARRRRFAWSHSAKFHGMSATAMADANN